MNYTIQCLRALQTETHHFLDGIHDALARWDLRNLGRRMLGEMPRNERGSGIPSAELFDTYAPHITDRLLGHLEEFSSVSEYAKDYGFFADVNPALKQLAHDAAELAYELSLYPGMSECPPLCRAHAALTGHWKESWSTGGVTESEYRVAVKSAALFLRQRPSRVQRTAAELINQAVSQDVSNNQQGLMRNHRGARPETECRARRGKP